MKPETNGHKSNGNGLPNAQARRDLFVAEYILSKNATKAAQKAGYSAHSAYSQGQRLLKNAEIQQRIAKAQEKRIHRLELTADYVLQGIRETVERCRQIEPVLDRKGEQVYCKTEDGEEVPAFTFNALGALKGYELLGKHLKLFTDRVEHLEDPAKTDPEIAETIREYAEKYGFTLAEAKAKIISEIKNPAAIAALDKAFPPLASEEKQ